MGSGADAVPKDPFLNPRRSSGGGRPLAGYSRDAAADGPVSASHPPTASVHVRHPAPPPTGAVSGSVGGGGVVSGTSASVASSSDGTAASLRTRKRQRASHTPSSVASHASGTLSVPRAGGRGAGAGLRRGTAVLQPQGRPPTATHGTSRHAGDVDAELSAGEDAYAVAASSHGVPGGHAPDDDDDGDGDAEERALAAAARSVVGGQGASATAAAATAASPHPWLVTDAFHVSLWYVLRYAGSALTAEDLWACRAVLSLTSTDAETSAQERGGLAGVVPGAAPAREEVTASHFDSWAWTGTEESELLLRLALRKSHSFTARHLELRYGDWLHVQSALNALAQRRFLWWTAPPVSSSVTGSTAPLTAVGARGQAAEDAVNADSMESPPTEELVSTAMSPSPLLQHYDGARVAALLLSEGSEAELRHRSGAVAAAPEQARGSLDEVVHVAQAVRAIELRAFLVALRQCSKARASAVDRESGAADPSAAASSPANRVSAAARLRVAEDASCDTLAGSAAALSSPPGEDGACGQLWSAVDNSVYDAIPGRKQDMIRYLVERRYSLWAPAAPADAPVLATPTSSSSVVLPCAPHTALPPASPGVSPSLQGPGRHASVCAAHTLACRRCFPTLAEEAEAVARCWDSVIGAVYSPHAGLRQHIVWMTELFHVLTSNNGAGVVSEHGAKAVAATMAVAAPPTLLMMRPQLLLLLQTLRDARHRCGSSPTAASLSAHGGCERPTAVVDGAPHALLPRWGVSQRLDGRSASTAASKAPAELLSHPPLPISAAAAAAAAPDVVQSSLPQPGTPAAGHAVGEGDLCDGAVGVTRSLPALDADEDSAVSGPPVCPPPVRLFASPAVLREYRRALAAQRALYDVTDGAVTAAQRFRGRSSAFVSHMHDTVMAAVRAGVAAVARHPHGASTTGTCTAADAVSPGLSVPLATASLESLLAQHGSDASHLLPFTPLYRWFACLELLFPLLQSARRYADANACLRHLLHDPIFVLHHVPDSGARSPVSPVTYGFRYKTHKRGEWLVRVAQNLSHQKRHAEALAVLEEAQAGYRELASQGLDSASRNAWLPSSAATNAAAAALSSVLAGDHSPESEAALPAQVQRRGRMLRVLWPATAIDQDSAANTVSTHVSLSRGPTERAHCGSVALRHAAWEYVRDRYCRRHDRLMLERLLVLMHRKVHQWTPLPMLRELTTRCLAEVAVRHISGVRDVMDRMLWREPTGSRRRHTTTTAAAAEAGHAAGNSSAGAVRTPQRRPASLVELFVLQHFLCRWNGASSTPTPAEVGEQCAESRGGGVDVGLSTTTASWRGAHCEGQWIACLARALLWDCYWAFPSHAVASACAASEGEGVPPRPPPPTDASHELLWLSAFQDGPLDVSTPIHFVLRRRAMIEARLAQLERCSREDLVAYVAAHIKVDAPREDGGEAAAAAAAAAAVRDADVRTGRWTGAGDGDVNGDEALRAPRRRTREECSEFEGPQEDSVLVVTASLSVPPSATSSVPREPSAPVEDACADATPPTHGDGETPSLCTGGPTRAIPEAWKVPVGALPLLDILRAVPLAPLWRLLRCLYLSPATEGVPLRFSGFPDLIFWRGGDDSVPRVAAEDIHGAPRAPFCLMEVKSPSDVLSTKQIAVNDLLHRCGFHVCVLRVDEVRDDGQRISAKCLR
ncbi:VRR-NUC domain containing protein [Novymonas esmeraldas]|uniref:Fanconi-associated nuclease n=1 Tax=Novymonas esmeraldas TaxID=1808958 RepID=A0AAW0F0F7_9TRYP